MKKNLKKLLAITLSIMTMMVFSAPAFAYTATDDDGDRSKASDGTMGVVYSSIGMFRTVDADTSVTLNEDGTKATVVVKTNYSKSSNYDRLALTEYSWASDQTEEAKAELDKIAINADNLGEDGNIADTQQDGDGNIMYSAQFTFEIPVSEFGKRIPYVFSQAGTWKTKAYYFVVVKAPLTVSKEDGLMMSIKDATLLINGTKEEPFATSYALDLHMGSDKYDKARVAGSTEEITADETNTFKNIPVTVGEVNVVEFHSKSKDEWYDRDVTINLEKASFYIEDHKAAIGDLEGLTEEETIAYVKENATPALLDQLIEAIQVQYRDENTDRYCAAAGACYDALVAQGVEVEDDGYFSDDTGDASKDNPRNTAPDKKKELLVVSFGTSFNDSRAATIGAIEKALEDEYGATYSVRRAFTAQIVINHIAARDGELINNVEQAMDKAVEADVTDMIVQPTHLMSGAEYDELKGQIDQYKDKIKITYAKPLLNSDADKEAVAKAVVAKTAEDAGYESLDAAVADKTAFVFMGHGTAHEANATYTFMQQTMDKLGYDNCFVGTVEGLPEPTALPEIKKAVEAKGYTKVILRPLMVVAGDHANNDMAADEEGSWYYAFVNGGKFEVEGQDQPVDIGEGFGAKNVTCQINGLGEIPAVQAIYVAHTKAAMPTVTPVVKKAQTLKVAKAQLTKTAKAKTLKKKAVYTTKVKVTGAKTTISYAKVSGSAKLTVVKTGTNKGKIKVKKGTKKGVYKIKIKITAKATAKYKKAYKTVTVKVRVK